MLVDGEEAIEYEDPDSFDEDNTCVRYIETKPGQKFGIKVAWLAGFRIQWADALYCQIKKGGEIWTEWNELYTRSLNHDRGALTKPAILNFSFSILKDPRTGKHTRCDWEFEGVEMGKLLLFPD